MLKSLRLSASLRDRIPELTMYYAIDDKLLSRLKTLASSSAGSADLITMLAAAEANPLVTSLIWEKADLLAASRRLIQGDNPKNPDGSRFNCNLPLLDSARERLAQGIAGDPDEFCVGIRDEVDNGIEIALIERIRDVVETELGEIGADHQGYHGVPCDDTILNHLAGMPDEIVAGGLNSCAREIAERAVGGLA